MYLHIGKECVLNNNELIGIFNIEILEKSNSYDYILENIAEKVIDISEGNPKSLILVCKENKNIAYISNILSSTIGKRINNKVGGSYE